MFPLLTSSKPSWYTHSMKRYDTIIIGAGASGLFCSCMLDGKNNLILEKGSKPGLKLLMAGSGQCNLTHGGSIKDFLLHYGSHGRNIRGVLQRYNNIELCRKMANWGVETFQREDGKIFPKSLKGRDVLDALIRNAQAEIQYNSAVESITQLDDEANCFKVSTAKEDYYCSNIVVATGGASYPTTGSDGSFAKWIAADMELEIEELRPALTSVFVENYPYGELSGISFKDIEISIEKGENNKLPDSNKKKGNNKATGDLLFTFKNFSGPVIINNSRDMKTGDTLVVNFLYPLNYDGLLGQFKKDFPKNNASPINYMIEKLGLPKRFAQLTASLLSMEKMKVSQLTGAQMKVLASELTAKRFSISGLAGFKEAMATAGGIRLSEISTKTMEAKKCKGLYFIGEVLDIDGDTGGYNLQFAFSSACAAAEHINSEKNI